MHELRECPITATACPDRLLQAFEAAARILSFTKAAAELFITQSAVSRQIKALKDHLEVALFERRARSLILTEHGQALYRVTADVLERLLRDQHAH
jgi:LysR family transcriptional regulator, glycine cleavage system transcriptional activator